jgi:hypothetical protein
MTLLNRVRLPRGAPPWRWVAAAAAAVVLAAAALLLARPRPAPAAAASTLALARVTEGTLTSQQQVNGTVEYANSYTLVAPAAGTFTELPEPGQVIRQGQALYALDGRPVVLLDGATPAYRTLFAGMRGPDVAELDADLVALGFASRADLPAAADTYTAATAAAVGRLQASLGLLVTGDLPLGQADFLPGPVSVQTVTPTVGAEATSGGAVLQVTSTVLEVVAQIDASLQSQVHVGDPATITLPDGSTTPGKVSKVAQLATPPSGSPAAGSQPSTSSSIEVDIAPTDPKPFQGLDNAVLDLAITTASVRDALAVPVTALLAQAGGGYAVEVVGSGGADHLVPVQLGIFDDGAGLVQVTGSGIHAGDRVAVAGT